MQSRLLFLSAHLPLPHARQAGQKTAFRNLHWLAEKYETHLVTFCNEEEQHYDKAALNDLCASLTVIGVTKVSRVKGIAAKPYLPFVVGARWSFRVENVISAILRKAIFDRVHCEWGQMAVYVPLFMNIPCRTLNLHDVLWQWCARRAQTAGHLMKALWNVEARRVKQWEQITYSKFSCVYVPSDKDRDLLIQTAKGFQKRVFVLAPHFEVFSIHRSEVPNSGRNLLFWGALRRKENLDGATWLIHQVLPLVRRSLPDAKLFIVGSGPPRWLSCGRFDGVEITGYVPDPTPYFEMACMAVLPLFCGAGVKIKVLECLAAGLPVLTTAVGAEGILAGPDGGLIVLHPDAELFARTVVELLNSPEQLYRLGRAAAQWVRNNVRNDKESFLMSPI